jgi:hypothetical protein
LNTKPIFTCPGLTLDAESIRSDSRALQWTQVYSYGTKGIEKPGKWLASCEHRLVLVNGFEFFVAPDEETASLILGHIAKALAGSRNKEL